MGFEVVDLEKSSRARAYEMFKNASVPTMVFTVKLDVTPLIRLKTKGYGFNSLLMYCILKAGRQFEGCYYDIKDGKLVKYDDMCVDMVVEGKDKGLYYMNLPYYDNYIDFQQDYIKTKKYCYENCCSYRFDGCACLATSAVINCEFEAISPNVSSDFMNPFFIWGKTHKSMLRETLNVSVRIHHACMDGQEVGALFNQIQKEINQVKQSIYKKEDLSF